MNYEKAIEILEAGKMCTLCANSSDKEYFSCKKVKGATAEEMREAFDAAIQAMREKQEMENMKCKNCGSYNAMLCVISKCYNNDPKNGYKTPFEPNDYCSYFHQKSEG